jgi:hypothetical protein
VWGAGQDALRTRGQRPVDAGLVEAEAVPVVGQRHLDHDTSRLEDQGEERRVQRRGDDHAVARTDQSAQ